jgi:hypothetical protein
LQRLGGQAGAKERPQKFSRGNRISINCRTMEFATLRSRLEVLHSLRRPSARDLTDFRQVWPRLNSEARGWLANAMVKIRPVTWDTVEIVDYDERWPADFRRIADEINAVLGELIIAVEHVGSTSVPGLAAKPIIDAFETIGSVTPRQRPISFAAFLSHHRKLQPTTRN